MTVHDLPGSDARRHVADKGTSAIHAGQGASSVPVPGWAASRRRRRAGETQRGALKPIAARAPCVSIPARIIEADTPPDAQAGLHRVRLTLGDDPVAQAMKDGLIETPPGTSADRASMARDREARAGGRRAAPATDCAPMMRTAPNSSSCRAPEGLGSGDSPRLKWLEPEAAFGLKTLQTLSRRTRIRPPISRCNTAPRRRSRAPAARPVAGLRASRRSTSADPAG